MEVEATTDQPISTTEEYAPGEERKTQILEEAAHRAVNGQSWWDENYRKSDTDRDFLSGNQWPANIKEERENSGRPMLVINRLVQFVNRVTNDMKQNRTQIKVHPTDINTTSKGKEAVLQNVAGNSDYALSEVLSALIKDIEYNSNADSHYDRASDQMVEGGLSWLRAYVAWATEDAFDLDLKIGSVRNPTSAMIDPLATEPDWSDSGWGFIFDEYPRKEFFKRWPNATIGDLKGGGDDSNPFYGEEDSVVVAEYFSREPCDYRLYLMDNGQVWSSRDLETDLIQPGKDGDLDTVDNPDNVVVIKQRDVKGWKVVWRKITRWDILEGGEDGIELPFSTVPLVPMLGREIVLKDKRNYESLIRHALDSQRQFNYWQTAATEMVALQPKQPYIGTELNFENNETAWKEANKKNFSYLTYTPDPMNGGAPPQRQPLAQNPAAEIQQALMADESMKATMGIYDASLGNVTGGEESGRAILARERQSDIGTYHFTDNRDKAIARIGKLLVEAIPKIYTDERVVRLKFADDSEDFVRLNTTFEVGGKEKKLVDIASQNYDVRVTSGPSYNTQRVEAVNTLIEFVQAVPMAGELTMDLIASNMDFPGADELAKRLKKALPAQFHDADDEDAPPPPPPDPNLQLQAQIEEAKTSNKQLDLAIIEANTRKKEVEGSQVSADTVKNLVARALAEIKAGEAEEADAGKQDKPKEDK